MNPRYRKLPQVCAKCRKLKMPQLGKFYYGPKYCGHCWICFECSSKIKNFNLQPKVFRGDQIKN